jgi:hypothetical protein
MATVTKDFRIKSGLVVEGTSGTINGSNIITEASTTFLENYVKDAAGALLEGATLENIQISYDENTNALSITAENGVADSTTNDLVEGTGPNANLYFTDQRAIDAVGGSATSDNDPNTVVKRDAFGNFAAGEITAELQGNVTGDVTGTVSDISNHNTDGLSEGSSNKYFTDQRALDATEEAYDAAGSAAQALADANSYTDGRETAITTAYRAYADQAEADAITTASADATTKANAALASSKSYTDDEISDLDLELKAYADQAEADAVTSANSYTDGRETAITAAYQSYADQVEVDAKAYADQKINDLVDGAPELLDTLNEIAAAINDDENFFTTIESQISLKADKTYVDTEISDLSSEAQGFADAAETAANAYTDAEITQEVADRNAAISSAITTEIADRNTAIGAAIDQEVIDRNSAITAAVDAIDTDDIEEGISNLYFTDQRAIDAVGGTIGDQIDLLTTDDIEEGSNNLYHTDVRAKTSAANLLTGASLTNITITGDETGLVITAENGVADSDTDDLTEGATNLYFTDARAVSALEAVVPNFTEVDINDVATQVAATATLETAFSESVYEFSHVDYRAAKLLVKTASGSHTQVSEILLTLDSSNNIAITEYAIVGTNGNIADISADIFDDNVRILVDAANTGTTVVVAGTLLK